MAVRRLPPNVVSSLRTDVSVYTIAQCVTELVLNAIDAGAVTITVRIDLKNFKLQVLDDGRGISFPDLKAVGSRYMTSKCQSVDDLRENLIHYGFRGEALCSIIEVSGTVQINSRSLGSEESFCKIFHAGKAHNIAKSQWSFSSCGTKVTIADFLCNRPVRKARIRPALELEEIKSHMEGIALINPQISLSLHDYVTNETIMQTHKTRDIKETFGLLFGEGLARNLIFIEETSAHFKVKGYIGKESHFLKNFQFLYVNKRILLKSKLHKLINAILSRSSILKTNSGLYAPISKDINHGVFLAFSPPKRDKHAVFVLDISCPYSSYDITYDPKKTLVEFADWESILYCIENLVRKFVEKEARRAEETDIWVEENTSFKETSVMNEVNQLAREAAAGLCNAKTSCVKNLLSAIHGLPASRKDVNFSSKSPTESMPSLLETVPVTDDRPSTGNLVMSVGTVLTEKPFCEDDKEHQSESILTQFSINSLCSTSHAILPVSTDTSKSRLSSDCDIQCTQFKTEEPTAAKRLKTSMIEESLHLHDSWERYVKVVGIFDPHISIEKLIEKPESPINALANIKEIRRKKLLKNFQKFSFHVEDKKVQLQRRETNIGNSHSKRVDDWKGLVEFSTGDQFKYKTNGKSVAVQTSPSFAPVKRSRISVESNAASKAQSCSKFGMILDNVRKKENPLFSSDHLHCHSRDTKKKSSKETDEVLDSTNKAFNRSSSPATSLEVNPSGVDDVEFSLLALNSGSGKFEGISEVDLNFLATSKCHPKHAGTTMLKYPLNVDTMNVSSMLPNVKVNKNVKVVPVCEDSSFSQRMDTDVVLNNNHLPDLSRSSSNLSIFSRNTHTGITPNGSRSDQSIEVEKPSSYVKNANSPEKFSDESQLFSHQNKKEYSGALHHCFSEDTSYPSQENRFQSREKSTRVTENSHASYERAKTVGKIPAATGHMRQSKVKLRSELTIEKRRTEVKLVEYSPSSSSSLSQPEGYESDTESLDAQRVGLGVLQEVRHSQLQNSSYCNKNKSLLPNTSTSTSSSDHDGNTERLLGLAEVESCISPLLQKVKGSSISVCEEEQQGAKDASHQLTIPEVNSHMLPSEKITKESQPCFFIPGEERLKISCDLPTIENVNTGGYNLSQARGEFSSHIDESNPRSVSAGSSAILSTDDVSGNALTFALMSNPTPISVEGVCNGSEWVEKKDNFGRPFYLHQLSGITSYNKPERRNVSLFSSSDRLQYLPKGMSPILGNKVGEKNNGYESSDERRADLISYVPLTFHRENLSTIKWKNNCAESDTDTWPLLDQLLCEMNNSSVKGQVEPQVSNVALKDVSKSDIQVFNSLHSYTFSKDIFKNIKVIGQLDEKFIVTVVSPGTEENILVLFDQHAVHERIRVESLTKEYQSVDDKTIWKSAPVEPALPLTLSAVEVRVLRYYQERISRLGLSFKLVDLKTIAVQRVPTCLLLRENREVHSRRLSTLRQHLESFIREQVDSLLNTRGVGTDQPTIIRSVISSEACHGAIKFGDPLSIADCHALLYNLSFCDLPFQCAHGRPGLMPILNLSKIQKVASVSRPNLLNLQKYLKRKDLI